MPKIHSNGEHPFRLNTSPAVSILNALVREGVKIRHDCGGKALCGTCKVRVVAGAAGLSPVSERERLRLDAIGASPEERLACQSYAFRDVELELPPRKLPDA